MIKKNLEHSSEWWNCNQREHGLVEESGEIQTVKRTNKQAKIICFLFHFAFFQFVCAGLLNGSYFRFFFFRWSIFLRFDSIRRELQSV